jgi:hypothetical protein
VCFIEKRDKLIITSLMINYEKALYLRKNKGIMPLGRIRLK